MERIFRVNFSWTDHELRTGPHMIRHMPTTRERAVLKTRELNQIIPVLRYVRALNSSNTTILYYLTVM